MGQKYVTDISVNTKEIGNWILMARCDRQARTQLFDVIPYTQKAEKRKIYVENQEQKIWFLSIIVSNFE